MPNKCKFIFKSFSIFFLLLVTSCASLNQQQSLEATYIGKFQLTQDNNSSIFNITISKSSEMIIIQVKKALLGNVAKITIEKSKPISVFPKQNYKYRNLLNEISPDTYLSFINKCLELKKVDNKITEINNNLNIACTFEDNFKSILIQSKDGYLVKGKLKKYED